MDKKILRAKKIIGQTEGIYKMLESNRECSDIIQQIEAARSALAKLGIEIVLEDNEKCKRKLFNKESLRSYLEAIFKLS